MLRDTGRGGGDDDSDRDDEEQGHHECIWWHLEKTPLWAGAADGDSASAFAGREGCLFLQVGTDSRVLRSTVMVVVVPGAGLKK